MRRTARRFHVESYRIFVDPGGRRFTLANVCKAKLEMRQLKWEFELKWLEDGRECDGTLALPSPPLMPRTSFLLFKGRCVPSRAHTTVTDKDLRRVRLSGTDVIRGDAAATVAR
ncbi:hypothetical protein ALC57_09835 [Trachymyrmex cornetzi]|uniref:Uncharacterized protein n=1 Tax=Trachymyrmex cornetzi TaxID=471704 RepID=A0A195DYK2_9HYME|nr:hypothetical protein ALC57_09835 [Trachymyrmex cornetzi]